jgi:hypothetical protein
MNIHSTIKALYAIMCEAEQGDKSPAMVALLRTVSDDDVNRAVSELEWMLGELKSVDDKIRGMYMLHYTTSIDREHVIFRQEMVYGQTTIKVNTLMDQKATQSLIEALGMILAMAKAGDKLVGGGNA